MFANLILHNATLVQPDIAPDTLRRTVHKSPLLAVAQYAGFDGLACRIQEQSVTQLPGRDVPCLSSLTSPARVIVSGTGEDR